MLFFLHLLSVCCWLFYCNLPQLSICRLFSLMFFLLRSPRMRKWLKQKRLHREPSLWPQTPSLEPPGKHILLEMAATPSTHFLKSIYWHHACSCSFLPMSDFKGGLRRNATESSCRCSVCVFVGVWCGQGTTRSSSTTPPRASPCGTDHRSWLAEPTWTSTSRSLPTRKRLRMDPNPVRTQI